MISLYMEGPDPHAVSSLVRLGSCYSTSLKCYTELFLRNTSSRLYGRTQCGARLSLGQFDSVGIWTWLWLDFTVPSRNIVVLR